MAHELTTFLGLSSIVDDSELRECWKTVAQGLRDLTTEGVWEFRTPEIWRSARWWNHSPLTWATSQPLKAVSVEGFRIQTFDVVGFFRERVYEVLSAEANRFRVCVECRAAFIATKRQRFCTRPCAQRHRTRRYRRLHRDEVTARRRAAYERAQKRRYGANVRVAKRSSHGSH
jgi:hypothetical protein